MKRLLVAALFALVACSQGSQGTTSTSAGTAAGATSTAVTSAGTTSAATTASASSGASGRASVGTTGAGATTGQRATSTGGRASSGTGASTGTLTTTSGTTGATTGGGCACTAPDGETLACGAVGCAGGQRLACGADGTLAQCGSCADGGFPIGACGLSLPVVEETPPIVNVRDFGAVGDGVTDDTTAIQAALDSLTDGGTVEFPAGTYIYGGDDDAGYGVLHVRQPNVAMWGYGGAELRSNNQNSQAVMLEAPGAAIYGFLLTAPQFSRQSDLENMRIDVESSNNRVIDNHINGGAAGGIFHYGADHFITARNIVENTEADSIHMTQGPSGPSHDGQVLQNTATSPAPYFGDDLVAIIGYLNDDPDPDGMANANYNILIACNFLTNAGWGNGVDVGGGEDVTIVNNVISQISHAGGIKLGTEVAFPTYSTMNVLAEGNQISQIETGGLTADGTRTYYGAFEIAARQADTSVDTVLTQNNSVDDTINSGFRFQGSLCDLGFDDTAMDDLGGPALDTSSFAGQIYVDAGCDIGCSGNTLDGGAVTGSICTGRAMPTDVTGSSIPEPPAVTSACE